MSEKILPTHKERTAFVYVRQSSMEQVRHAKEGQRRQYGLQTRAQQLGFGRVVVIDDDLGKSGSGSVDRPGFGRLLTAVCEGGVGAVFALEASRLARNSRDWHHLIDLCAMTNTLVVDEDGIYDPQMVNDRLLLGLKGSMAEFELSLLRQRAREALLQMIGRGLVLREVPVGYVRTENYGLEIIADRQVQEAVRSVFAKFRQMGSARQVLLWYCQERIPLPHVKPGTGGREIHWGRPCYQFIIHILKNPTYAGTFVHGRTTSRTVMRDGRARKTQGHALPLSEWEVVIHDHHSAYISWEEFVRNQKQLRGNRAMGGPESGAVKNGRGLLVGLLRCARCGRRLHVSYSGRRPNLRYQCRGGQINHGTALCLSVGGIRLDQAVAAQLLDALQPIGVEAALEAAQQLSNTDHEKRRALELALEKARYESDRARRQYDAAEPENRLVASELETRWNEALHRVADLESRMQETHAQQAAVTAAERDRLLALGEDLRSLWQQPAAPMALKKRMLRTMIEDIIIDVQDDPAKVHLWLHWVGGSHTQVVMAKNRPGKHRNCTDQNVVDLVRELAKVCRDGTIAAVLNRLGYRTGHRNTWKEARVASLRYHNQIPICASTEQRTWRTLEEAAIELKVSPSVLRRLIRAKILPARQVIKHAPWVIEHSDLQLPAVRKAIRAVREGRKPSPRTAAGQRELPFK